MEKVGQSVPTSTESETHVLCVLVTKVVRCLTWSDLAPPQTPSQKSLPGPEATKRQGLEPAL